MYSGSPLAPCHGISFKLINLEIRCDLVTHNYPQTIVMHPPQPVSCSAMTHLKLHVIVVIVITVAVVAGEDVETCPQPGHVHSSFAVIGAKRRLPSFLHLVAIGPQLEELMGLSTQLLKEYSFYINIINAKGFENLVLPCLHWPDRSSTDD